MSRMRETHVRFCESKGNRVAPYFLATRFADNSNDLQRIRKIYPTEQIPFFGCLRYRVHFIGRYDLELRLIKDVIHMVFIKIVIKW